MSVKKKPLYKTKTSRQRPNPYPSSHTDHSTEIAALKKEIQALKDMIAEHILLGHQES